MNNNKTNPYNIPVPGSRPPKNVGRPLYNNPITDNILPNQNVPNNFGVIPQKTDTDTVPVKFDPKTGGLFVPKYPNYDNYFKDALSFMDAFTNKLPIFKIGEIIKPEEIVSTISSLPYGDGVYSIVTPEGPELVLAKISSSDYSRFTSHGTYVWDNSSWTSLNLSPIKEIKDYQNTNDKINESFDSIPQGIYTAKTMYGDELWLVGMFGKLRITSFDMLIRNESTKLWDDSLFIKKDTLLSDGKIKVEYLPSNIETNTNLSVATKDFIIEQNVIKEINQKGEVTNVFETPIEQLTTTMSKTEVYSHFVSYFKEVLGIKNTRARFKCEENYYVDGLGKALSEYFEYESFIDANKIKTFIVEIINETTVIKVYDETATEYKIIFENQYTRGWNTTTNNLEVIDLAPYVNSEGILENIPSELAKKINANPKKYILKTYGIAPNISGYYLLISSSESSEETRWYYSDNGAEYGEVIAGVLCINNDGSLYIDETFTINLESKIINIDEDTLENYKELFATNLQEIQLIHKIARAQIPTLFVNDGSYGDYIYFHGSNVHLNEDRKLEIISSSIKVNTKNWTWEETNIISQSIGENSNSGGGAQIIDFSQYVDGDYPSTEEIQKIMSSPKNVLLTYYNYLCHCIYDDGAIFIYYGTTSDAENIELANVNIVVNTDGEVISFEESTVEVATYGNLKTINGQSLRGPGDIQISVSDKKWEKITQNGIYNSNEPMYVKIDTPLFEGEYAQLTEADYSMYILKYEGNLHITMGDPIIDSSIGLVKLVAGETNVYEFKTLEFFDGQSYTPAQSTQAYLVKNPSSWVKVTENFELTANEKLYVYINGNSDEVFGNVQSFGEGFQNVGTERILFGAVSDGAVEDVYEAYELTPMGDNVYSFTTSITLTGANVEPLDKSNVYFVKGGSQKDYYTKEEIDEKIGDISSILSSLVEV